MARQRNPAQWEGIYDGAAMLVWPRGVFHRIRSDQQTGSASLNFRRRYEGFDIDTNFNIYDLDPSTGEYRTLRAGYLDQPRDSRLIREQSRYGPTGGGVRMSNCCGLPSGPSSVSWSAKYRWSRATFSGAESSPMAFAPGAYPQRIRVPPRVTSTKNGSAAGRRNVRPLARRPRIGGQRLDVVEPHRLPLIAQCRGDFRPADHLGVVPNGFPAGPSARDRRRQARIAGGFDGEKSPSVGNSTPSASTGSSPPRHLDHAHRLAIHKFHFHARRTAW